MVSFKISDLAAPQDAHKVNIASELTFQVPTSSFSEASRQAQINGGFSIPAFCASIALLESTSYLSRPPSLMTDLRPHRDRCMAPAAIVRLERQTPDSSA